MIIPPAILRLIIVPSSCHILVLGQDPVGWPLEASVRVTCTMSSFIHSAEGCVIERSRMMFCDKLFRITPIPYEVQIQAEAGQRDMAVISSLTPCHLEQQR